MKILIIQQRYGIGDLIIFLPYIHAISKKFKTKVSLLVKESSKASDLLSNDKNIDEIIILDKDKDGIKGFFKLSNEIKKRNFDKVFIFNSSLRYNLIAKFSGIKSVFQYPLFRSKDNLVHSAKIFTENVTGEIISTEPNLNIKSIDKFDKNIKHIDSDRFCLINFNASSIDRAVNNSDILSKFFKSISLVLPIINKYFFLKINI